MVPWTKPVSEDGITAYSGTDSNHVLQYVMITKGTTGPSSGIAVRPFDWMLQSVVKSVCGFKFNPVIIECN